MKTSSIIYQDRFLTIKYEALKNVIIFHWSSFFIPLEKLQEAHILALNFAKTNEVSTYIADTAKTEGVLYDSCIQWWGDFFPNLTKKGIKKIITIVPTNALQKQTTKIWQAKMVGGIETINTDSLQTALMKL